MYPYSLNTNRGKNEKFRYTVRAIQMIDAAIDWLKTEAEPAGETGMTSKRAKQSGYQWTGDITELVETCYALAESGSVNDGQLEIKAFITFLAEVFHIPVKRCYDFYSKMRTRSGSRTAFLDKMKKRLELRMDRDDERRYKYRR